jgi:HSP20 family protein
MSTEKPRKRGFFIWCLLVLTYACRVPASIPRMMAAHAVPDCPLSVVITRIGEAYPAVEIRISRPHIEAAIGPLERFRLDWARRGRGDLPAEQGVATRHGGAMARRHNAVLRAKQSGSSVKSNRKRSKARVNHPSFTEDIIMYRSMFPRDLFAEFDRLQREIQQAFDNVPNIRGAGAGSFPALNVGRTPQSLELYAFVPGMDPKSIEVNLERGVLTIAGERQADLPPREERSSVHINERFAGRFRRVISLPDDDVNPDGVTAQYRDGVLQISIKRRTAPQARRINVQ